MQGRVLGRAGQGRIGEWLACLARMGWQRVLLQLCPFLR